MKQRHLAALSGTATAMILGASAQAAPSLVVTTNTTSAFLVANNLQSATISITGFTAAERLQGFVGTPQNPWTVTCSSGTFFNVGFPLELSSSGWSGNDQFAGTSASGVPNAVFDTGTLAGAGALGTINATTSNAIGFAQFGVGQNSGSGTDVSWLSINAAGVRLGTGTYQLMRLTWSASASATFSALAITNTGNQNGFEYALSVTIPAVPAPSAAMLLMVAAVTSSPRRRRCDSR